MFLGHFAVALGAKRYAPSLSLGTLFLAAQWLDLLWPTLLLLDVESVRIDPGNTSFTPLDFVSYPISHGLLAVVGWAALVGSVIGLVARSRRAGMVTGTLVVSHWLLDLLTHRPDLSLLPGSEIRVGLGLWSSVPATLAVELTLFAVGMSIYVGATRPRDRTGTVALVGLALFLLLAYAANVAGPPPPNVAAISWTGQAQWLLVLWAYWIDRHRRDRAEALAGTAGVS